MDIILSTNPSRCVGSAMASSVRPYRCHRNENFCDQFFTKFNDTESACNREPELTKRKKVISLMIQTNSNN